MFRLSRPVRMMSHANSTFTRPSPESSVFFLCDVQETFRGVMEPTSFNKLIAHSRFLLQSAQRLEIPLVISEQNPFKPTVPELALLFKDQLDSPSIHFERKTLFSMLTPSTQAYLSSHPERRHAYIFGIEGHVCVMQTALDLLRSGYSVFIVQDAVMSQSGNDFEMALKRLSDAGCIITTSQSAIYELLQDASNPNFKPILSHVKEHIQAIKEIDENK